MSLDFRVGPVARRRVRELVARWHAGVRTGNAPDSAAAADELAAGLLLPDLLDRLPRRVRALTVVPDDALHGFPFAAIRPRGRFLVEDYAVSVGADRSPAPPPAPRPGGKALVVAVSQGAPKVPPLPGTLPEAARVGTWLAARGAGVEALADATADRAAVLRAWESAAFVHVACHGIFQSDQPDASGLVLVPVADRVELLSLSDLAGLRADRLRHVTLSNCWGADSFVAPGRWVISLPEAIRRSGAESVLACLWPVDDEVNPAFIERFYQYLDHHPRDEALRRAQLDCLRGALALPTGRSAAHPFHWAGFVLHGEPGVLRLGGTE
jgi:CHAT domain-containing protein